MIQTIRKNFYNFTGEEIEKVKLSCKTQLMVANPPDESFKEIVDVSGPNNFPVEVNDVSN